jgi:hypothetical protein
VQRLSKTNCTLAGLNQILDLLDMVKEKIISRIHDEMQTPHGLLPRKRTAHGTGNPVVMMRSPVDSTVTRVLKAVVDPRDRDAEL